MSADLVATLETPLPAALPAGAVTAVFCYGRRSQAVEPLDLVVDGVRYRADVAGGAFWGIVPVRAVEPAVELELASAGRAAPLGRIATIPPAPPAAPRGASIAVCMATFEPDPALFRAQVESLHAQSDHDWVCVISDDCSAPDAFAQIEQVVGDDDRFVLSRSVARLGFYRNFERALTLAPADAELIALCDQDDRWWPDKLAVLRDALGSAQLVYSDQRLVDANGRVLRETMWRGRRNNHTNLASLLVANSITGASALFRREVAELALPFPETPGLQFHDHWIGLVALAAGDVAYVDRPLYDYVQHRGAFFGEVTSGGAGPRSSWRGAYFRGYLPRVALAEVLLLRCAGRLTSGKRRALRRFAAAARSPMAFAWLAARPLRVMAGRTETLGSESELVRGILWRRLRARSADVGLPELLSFQQRRLRRWRARV